MHRFWEIILGLDKGFLGRQGEFSLQFNPSWPGQQYVGAATWNLVLAAAAIALVIYVYRREGRSRPVRVGLGVVRAALLALLIILLNRPVLTLGQVRTEPSVLAVLVDDSISMRVPDAIVDGKSMPRIQAVEDLLTGRDAELLRNLAKQHEIKIYRFDAGPQPVATVDGPGASPAPAAPTTQPQDPSLTDAVQKLASIKPLGESTQVVSSVKGVVEDLQGQRLTGVVVLTDGRDTPSERLADLLDSLKNLGAKIYPVAVGSDKAPQNIEVQGVDTEASAFVDDLHNVKVTVRGTGYEPNHQVTIVLKKIIDPRTKASVPLQGEDGADVKKTVTLPDDKPVTVDMQFKPKEPGTLDLIVEAVKQDGELTEEDNTRTAQVAVLDAQVRVLFVDGYPRWDYRYLKTMLLRSGPRRDASGHEIKGDFLVSCLLTSADPSFAQEGSADSTHRNGTWAIKSFPVSIEQLMDYDVVLFGDVDPRQFTDAQLQLVSDFVSKKGGGFGMVAGPRWSPQAYKNTPIEPLLPVNISRTDEDDSRATITQGFRPVLTRDGEESPVFRFFSDKEKNAHYLKNDLQQIFWYCRGLTVKPTGVVLAEHPTDPDGNGVRKAPILVVGRFGAGRTLFSAIDDSWRWRYYTGESIFDTYWVQQLRYLARSRKLGERKMTFTAMAPSYDLGQLVTVQMRVLAPQLLQQLPPQIPVEVVDAAGQTVKRVDLVRQERDNELYQASWTADQTGDFSVRLPKIVGDVDEMTVHVKVGIPKFELEQPEVDHTLLSQLASPLGQVVGYNQARTKLPELIRSAAKIIPVETSRPLWDAPLALLLFVGLITLEWVMRKVFGML